MSNQCVGIVTNLPLTDNNYYTNNLDINIVSLLVKNAIKTHKARCKFKSQNDLKRVVLRSNLTAELRLWGRFGVVSTLLNLQRAR